jgi:diguanylate cyclase (GGDEF)-like protein
MKDLGNILSLFTKCIILKIDKDGKILDTILKTSEGVNIGKYKNVYSLFTPEEASRVKRAIEMNFDGRKKYIQINPVIKEHEYVDVDVCTYKSDIYMYIQFFQSDRDREIEREVSIEKLLDLSERDILTKTLNRQGFFTHLKSLIETSDPDKRIGIIFLDIDNLKKINDTFGHIVGDKAIRSVSTILTSTVRQRDILARVGGDEFVIAVEEVSGHKSTVYGLAKRLFSYIQKQEEEYSTTISMGVHVFKAKKLLVDIKNNQKFEKALSLEIKEADKATYDAKNAGKNQICVSEGYKKYYKAASKASK